MRHLNKVRPHERFVASGTYNGFRGGTPYNLTEKWTLHEHPDGAQFARIDWSLHDGEDDKTRLMEAWRSPPEAGGRIERLDLLALNNRNDAEINRVRATYTFSEHLIEIGRTVDDQPREYHEFPVQDNFFIYSLSVLIDSWLAAQWIEGEDKPATCFAYREESAFEGLMCHQTLRAIGETELTIGEKTFPVRQYERVLSGEGDSEHMTQLWLDQYGIPLKQVGPKPDHAMNLTEYARRPEQS